MKYINKKGEEVEVEETEVITAIKDEYEKKLVDKDKEITKLKDEHEKKEKALREEHVKQMRALLTGRKEEKQDNEFEEPDPDDEEELLKQAKEILKKER